MKSTRLRALDGHIIYSDDRSGASETEPEDEVIEAAHGETEAELTRLNSDAEDVGPLGPAVVEVYQPLLATQSHHQIGVLEIYLPYGPIAADISRGQRAVFGAAHAGIDIAFEDLVEGAGAAGDGRVDSACVGHVAVHRTGRARQRARQGCALERTVAGRGGRRRDRPPFPLARGRR